MNNFFDSFQDVVNLRRKTQSPWWNQAGTWIGIAGLIAAVLVPIFLRPEPQALPATRVLTNTPSSTPSPLPKTSTPTPPPPTSTPTPTNTPTQEPTATPQPLSSSNVSEEWNTILADDFSSNNNQWVIESGNDEYSKFNYQIQDGWYRWESEANQGFISWNYPDIRQLTDFYLSVDAKQMKGVQDACYGLVFRNKDDNNLYQFCINNLGEYKVDRLYKNQWEYLVYWDQSPHINPQEKNTLTVIAQGPEMKFYINGILVAQTKDDLISEGLPAIGIEMYNQGNQGVFAFDNFIVRVPPIAE